MINDVELCCPGLMAWSMAEFSSAQHFAAICVWLLQEWSLWQSDEQSVWSDRMLYSGTSLCPCCYWWYWLVCFWKVIAGWFVFGSTLLLSDWPASNCVMFGAFKVHGLVLHNLKLDTKTSLPSGFFLSAIDHDHQAQTTGFYTRPAMKTQVNLW